MSYNKIVGKLIANSHKYNFFKNKYLTWHSKRHSKTHMLHVLGHTNEHLLSYVPCDRGAGSKITWISTAFHITGKLFITDS